MKKAEIYRRERELINNISVESDTGHAIDGPICTECNVTVTNNKPHYVNQKFMCCSCFQKFVPDHLERVPSDHNAD